MINNEENTHMPEKENTGERRPGRPVGGGGEHKGTDSFSLERIIFVISKHINI